MAKDDNLFEDVMKESSDLLDIGLDDLSDDAGSEVKGDEADEGIIDLLDLVEKGDAELFGNDDAIEEDMITAETAETSYEDNNILTEEKDVLDDILLDADTSAPADDLGVNLDEDMSDEMVDDNIQDDADNTHPDQDISGDMFEKLLDDTVLDELTEDTEELPESITEFNLEPEDFSDLESVMEEGPLSDEKTGDSPVPGGVQGNLFRDFDPVASASEETNGLDDVLKSEPDIFGEELEKTIASPDDLTDEKSLWGTDASDNTLNAEPEGVSILEETSSDDEKIEYSGMDSDDTGFVNLDDIQLDSKSVDELFPGDEVMDVPESVYYYDDFKQEESKELLSSVMEQTESVPSVEPVVSEILATDEDIPAVQPATIVQPVISEEKIEEIVTKLVGEVVERVAREVFKEVAEKVISEAIEGLKKSLEAELE